MNTDTLKSTGCGGGCRCAGNEPTAVASINGIALHEAGQTLDQTELKERAYTELLRQQAVRSGLLPRHTGLTAPEPTLSEREVIERMLDQVVTAPDPTEEECQRFYNANLAKYMVGQALHVRHILFAVTPGVNVHGLTLKAEQALLELSRTDASPDRFGQLAAELSNCPTGANGGDLGWIGPDDCAPELANELFFQKNMLWGMGLHPRLIHTRFGFHILHVLGRRKGKQATFAEVHERIATQLTLSARAKALHQYMSLLAGQAVVEGVELASNETPLVQ